MVGNGACLPCLYWMNGFIASKLVCIHGVTMHNTIHNDDSRVVHELGLELGLGIQSKSTSNKKNVVMDAHNFMHTCHFFFQGNKQSNQ
jgi:hypothetical protein